MTSVAEIYAYCVLYLRLPPTYVLDDMSKAELNALITYSYFANKASWEQTRFNATMTLQSQSTKPIKQESLMRFPWEDIHHDEDSDEVIDEVAKRQEEMLASFRSKKNIEDGTGL